MHQAETDEKTLLSTKLKAESWTKDEREAMTVNPFSADYDRQEILTKLR